MTVWRDPLALTSTLRRTGAEFGGELRGITSLRTSSELNDRPRASFTLVASDPPLDYLSELRIKATVGSTEHLMFTGFVNTAEPDTAEVRVEALSATELTERTIGALKTSGVSAPEVIYLIAREAGYTDDRLQIQGIDGLPTEVFEVLVPVAGLELDEPLVIGGVTLVPADWTAAGRPVAPAEPFKHLDLAPYRCVAVAVETAARVRDAEVAATSRIELVLDGLLASTLYGFSAKPDGTNIPFARSIVRARPRRLAAVCVYGLGSDRMWVRDTLTHRTASSVHAGLLHRRWQDLQFRPPPTGLSDMLAALRRAADETQSSVQRGQALWDAIEFLTAGISIPPAFSKAERRAIRTALQTVSLTEQQRKRLENTLQRLNEPSLSLKMQMRAAADGVPLGQSEIELLQRLRAARNDAAHGRRPPPVSEHDLRWAVSMVARLIMFRWHRSTYPVEGEDRGLPSGGAQH